MQKFLYENINFQIDDDNEVILQKNNVLKTVSHNFDIAIAIQQLSKEPIFVNDKNNLHFNEIADKVIINQISNNIVCLYIKENNNILYAIKVNNIINATIHFDLYINPHLNHTIFEYYANDCIITKICNIIYKYNHNNKDLLNIQIDDLYMLYSTIYNFNNCVYANVIEDYKDILPKHLYIIDHKLFDINNIIDFKNNNFNNNILCFIIQKNENDYLTFLSDKQIENTLNYLKNSNFKTVYYKYITDQQFKKYFKLPNINNCENYLIDNKITQKIVNSTLTIADKLDVFFKKISPTTGNYRKIDQDYRIILENRITRHCTPKSLANLNEKQILNFEKQLICEFAALLCILHQPFNEDYFEYEFFNKRSSAYIIYKVNNVNILEYLYILLHNNIFKMPKKDIYELCKNYYNYFLDNYL